MSRLQRRVRQRRRARPAALRLSPSTRAATCTAAAWRLPLPSCGSSRGSRSLWRRRIRSGARTGSRVSLCSCLCRRSPLLRCSLAWLCREHVLLRARGGHVAGECRARRHSADGTGRGGGRGAARGWEARCVNIALRCQPQKTEGNTCTGTKRGWEPAEIGSLLRPLGLGAAERVESTGSVYQRLLGQAESALQGADWFTLHSDRLPAQGSDGAGADATMADAADDSMAEDDAPVPAAAWEVGKGLHATVRFAPCVSTPLASVSKAARDLNLA